MREIFEKMRDAFESCVARYMVGFVFPFKSTPHLDVAAGVAVKWNGRRLIVTARHVLTDEDFDGVHLLLPLEQPFDRGGPIMVPKEPHPMVAMPVPRTSFVQCEWEDLGFFEVASDFGGSSDLDFYPLPPYARTPGSDTGCVLMGFPEDLRDLFRDLFLDQKGLPFWLHVGLLSMTRAKRQDFLSRLREITTF